MAFERRFDLDGCLIVVHGEGADLSCVIDRLLGPYASSATEVAPPGITIRLTRRLARPQPPAEKPRFLFPPLGAWAAGPDGWHLVDDVAELRVGLDAKHSTIEGWVGSDAPMELMSRFAGLSLWVALIECLRARARFPLHGAALLSPEGDTVLFSGTKGAGKSTATLSLLERGYDVVTDDTLFLERMSDGTVELYGYRKRFHVRNDLIARRPDLAPYAHRPEPYEPQDKLWLAMEERFPGRTHARAAAPTRIFFPSIVARSTSRVVPLAPRETLLRLLADSSFVFVRQDVAPAHLACLRTLADGAAGFLLECGRDVLDDPSIYLQLVAPPAPRAGEKVPSWPSSASASS